MSHVISKIVALILDICFEYSVASPPPIGNSTDGNDWHDLPAIISETLVDRFFYWNRSLQVGMRYGTEIYTLLKSYALHERLQASDTACHYAAQRIEVCITVSKTAYSVWLNLRSLSENSASLIGVGSSADALRCSRAPDANAPDVPDAKG